MEEHSISTDKFTALWIPTYGFDDGFYNAAPDTATEYDLHQYTSQGQLNGFSHYLDLTQIAPTQNQEAIYQKLFKVEKDSYQTAVQVTSLLLLFFIPIPFVNFIRIYDIMIE